MKTRIIYLLFIATGLVFSLSIFPFSTEEWSNNVDKLRKPVSYRLNGYLGEKLYLSCKNRIMAQDVDRLIAPFRERTETRCWQSEFWGKWITSAILAYNYSPQPQLKKIIDKAVSELILTQSPDGYIGNYIDSLHLEKWDIWGRKYCMLGLLSYFELTNDSIALKATCRLADHLIKELDESEVSIVKKGNFRGMASSSVLEPVCLLYKHTRDSKYLQFADKIVRDWETDEGPQLISKSNIDVANRFPGPSNWWSWENGKKAYEMMSCYEGLIELYRLTGKPEYLNAVKSTWENIKEKEINIVGSGASMECWFHGKKWQHLPVNHYQETCVTVTWLKLNYQLLKLTGEAKYAEAMETCYYNALLAAMNQDGSNWSKYTELSGIRTFGNEQCNMGINCCVANGPRGLFTFPKAIIMSSNKGIQINFFTEGEYKIKTPGNQIIKLIQESKYPANNKVKIKIKDIKPEEMVICIRIPEWSENTIIEINGNAVNQKHEKQLISLKRMWHAEDEISIKMEMKGRIVSLGTKPDNLAILYGPIVLTQDTRLMNILPGQVFLPVTDKNGTLLLKKNDHDQENIWMSFTVPVQNQLENETEHPQSNIILCDYSSAGNSFDNNSMYKVWFQQLLDPRDLME